MYNSRESTWRRMLHWGRKLGLKLAMLGGVYSSWRFSDKIIFVRKSSSVIASPGKLTPVSEEKLLEMKIPGSDSYSLIVMKPCESFRIQKHFWSCDVNISFPKYGWFSLQAQSKLQTSINVLGNRVNGKGVKRQEFKQILLIFLLRERLLSAYRFWVCKLYPVWWFILLACKGKN